MGHDFMPAIAADYIILLLLLAVCALLCLCPWPQLQGDPPDHQRVPGRKAEGFQVRLSCTASPLPALMNQ
jgi:hypothetical protein